MSDVVIRAENLGKQFRIGAAQHPRRALREAVTEGVRSLGRRLLGRGLSATPDETLWALKDVGFELRRGDCVGVIGRNGAGKSTLLKILARVTEPTTGRVGLKGRVASLLEVGTGFHPELTGRENVFLNGAILGLRRHEVRRRFDAIIAFAEVERFVDTPVKHYSSGMYLRLAFAVAAHLEPEILIIDEVLAVGDAAFQQKCLGKMGEVASSGRTLLFVSHNLSSVATLCNRGLLLERGRAMPFPTAAEAIAAYMRTYSPACCGSWEGSLGDETLQLRTAALRLEGRGEPLFYRGEAFSLTFSYDLTRHEPQLLIGLELFNAAGHFLCATRATDQLDHAAAERLRRAGRHAVAVLIDTSILAEGNYVLRLDLGIHCVKRIIDDQVQLGFAVINERKNVGQDSPTRQGIIYPDWAWEACP